MESAQSRQWSKVGRGKRKAIVAVACLSVAAAPFIYFGMYAGDAEIHLVYGESASTGRFFEFNPGETSSGVTSIGYMLLLAQIFRIVPIEYVPLAIKILNIAGWYVLAALTFRLGRTLLPEGWALAAAVVVGVMPGSVYNSTIGMESGLFALAVLATVYLMAKGHWLTAGTPTSLGAEIQVGATLALCVALRPEGLPFAAVVLGYAVRINRPTPGLFRRTIVAAIPPAALTVAFAVFHHAYTGDWLPGSAVSRVAMSSGDAISIGPFWFDPSFLSRLVVYLPITAMFLVGNGVIVARGARSGASVEGMMAVIFWVFFGLYSTVLGSFHLARYVTFLMPMMVLLAAVGARWLWSRWHRVTIPQLRPLRTFVFVGLAVFLIGLFIVETYQRLRMGGRDELWRVMRAPAMRNAYSAELLAELGNPTSLPVSIAYQEVQVRYWLDERFVVRSLDGRTDSLLRQYVKGGNYDHVGYLKRRNVNYVAELVYYNRDRTQWSLAWLDDLQVGESVEHNGVVFTLLANGMFKVEW